MGKRSKLWKICDIFFVFLQNEVVRNGTELLSLYLQCVILAEVYLKIPLHKQISNVTPTIASLWPYSISLLITGNEEKK